jgi:hypothetical protein
VGNESPDERFDECFDPQNNFSVKTRFDPRIRKNGTARKKTV